MEKNKDREIELLSVHGTLNHMFNKMAENGDSVVEVSKLSTKSCNNCFRLGTQRFAGIPLNLFFQITKEHEA